MIIDNLKNIYKYEMISKPVADFLLSLSQGSEVGYYEIDKTAFANIDEYNTKFHNICKFEAHKKYIDVQMLLDGEEEIDCVNIEGLEISEEYSQERDVMFFQEPNQTPDKIAMIPFKFAMFCPEDAHKPQMNSKQNSQKVKKVVVKILV